jgi:hypothetical protein
VGQWTRALHLCGSHNLELLRSYGNGVPGEEIDGSRGRNDQNLDRMGVDSTVGRG